MNQQQVREALANIYAKNAKDMDAVRKEFKKVQKNRDDALADLRARCKHEWVAYSKSMRSCKVCGSMEVKK